MTEKRKVPTDDVATLGEWCRLVIEFLIAHSPNEDRPMYAPFEEVVQRGFAGTTVAGMKDAVRLLTEMARELPPQLQEQLDRLLISKVGKGLRSSAREQVTRVDRIL